MNRRSWPAACAIAALGALLAVVAACDSPTAPSNNAPFSQTDLTVGIGATAVANSVLTVNYTGWLYNATAPDNKGVQFDSSVGREAFVFTLGRGEVIAGWDQGVLGMKVGGVRRLVIPPPLAYGPGRRGPIPPNATLLFDIELVDVQ